MTGPTDVVHCDVRERVCATHGVTMDELLSSSRKARIVSARADAAWALHNERGMSFSSVGRLLRRSHTAVAKLVRKRDVPRGWHGNDPAPL